MLLSAAQQKRFWREWHQACQYQGWTKAKSWTDAQISNERYAMLRRAGFESLTEVDPHAGFTAVLKELAALRDDVSAMLRADDNPKRTLIFAIYKADKRFIRGYDQSALSPYTREIMRDRFKHTDLDRLSEDDLRKLLMTIDNREPKPSPSMSISSATNEEEKSDNPF